ncbi:hypothetical protein [Pseudomonas sp. MWU13-3659]|uniref:hypothetical protein n=1 Tax=Pseudomonas sp. MWU13-3659 TaxID=2986964 RepID=UPI002074F07A|nr:hypothetical protein [Pseudomonas sp. MWU13-3659]
MTQINALLTLTDYTPRQTHKLHSVESVINHLKEDRHLTLRKIEDSAAKIANENLLDKFIQCIQGAESKQKLSTHIAATRLLSELKHKLPQHELDSANSTLAIHTAELILSVTPTTIDDLQFDRKNNMLVHTTPDKQEIHFNANAILETNAHTQNLSPQHLDLLRQRLNILIKKIHPENNHTEIESLGETPLPASTTGSSEGRLPLAYGIKNEVTTLSEETFKPVLSQCSAHTLTSITDALTFAFLNNEAAPTIIYIDDAIFEIPHALLTPIMNYIICLPVAEVDIGELRQALSTWLLAITHEADQNSNPHSTNVLSGHERSVTAMPPTEALTHAQNRDGRTESQTVPSPHSDPLAGVSSIRPSEPTQSLDIETYAAVLDSCTANTLAQITTTLTQSASTNGATPIKINIHDVEVIFPHGLVESVMAHIELLYGNLDSPELTSAMNQWFNMVATRPFPSHAAPQQSPPQTHIALDATPPLGPQAFFNAQDWEDYLLPMSSRELETFIIALTNQLINDPKSNTFTIPHAPLMQRSCLSVLVNSISGSGMYASTLNDLGRHPHFEENFQKLYNFVTQ